METTPQVGEGGPSSQVCQVDTQSETSHSVFCFLPFGFCLIGLKDDTGDQVQDLMLTYSTELYLPNPYFSAFQSANGH